MIQNKKSLIVIGIISILFHFIVSATPLLNFTSPTPENTISTTNTSIEINASINEANLNELIYNWNGTNYTIYNNSLILMMNLDNISVLNENSTHVVDVSMSGNNGTIQGNANIDLFGGKYGGAFNFDGVDDYIIVPDSEIFDTGNQITTSAWIKTNFSNQTAIGIVLHDNSRYKWLLYFTGGSTFDSLSFYINSSSGVKSAGCDYAEGAVADNQWHLLTGTYDRTLSSKRIKIYYDGVQCGTADGYDEPITEGDEGVWIGRWGGEIFQWINR